jgi:hypothetical protein
VGSPNCGRGERWLAAKTEEEREPFVDSEDFFAPKLAEHVPNSPLIERSQMVDQGEGRFDQAAAAWRKGRIKDPRARCPCDWHHAQERKALVADDVRIAYHDARPHTKLLVPEGRVEFR